VRADKVAAWIQSVTGRKLVRTPCDAPDDAAATAAPDDDGGGCNAGGSAGLGVMLAFGVLRRRRSA
jgi:uncharacterized protein (TIGR03382 family)